ncbi:TON1 Recruiting Motif 4, LONGIFOLIA 3 [Hibiscus trionum]|uniref:TON1 Recruiting Motif 4, LONGIFOLIA 3 n=1 Tax=Hibiscus trionum TaxID=183268 RepID=A0A9W7HG14_HIBTR|nr:TON1 Recruiting Motif 4, LONGIFOLIA 3 [Hibiscus trionum]
MAAKLLHSLADENPDLQKQMGCMVGAYQIFDNHHMLTTKRLSHGNLPAGNSQLNNGIHEGDSNNAFHRQTAMETNINRSGNEQRRISTESSRASFSSSRSSSFSSLDYNKAAQQEVPFPETPDKETIMDQPSTSPHVGSQCIDLRDVVKDSMYREGRGLLVRTTAREEVLGSTVKHRDSLRPFQHASYGAGINGKQNVRDDLKESLRVLSKLRESPWYYNNEAREPQRSSHEANGSWNSMSRDANAPRFSYDGREVNHLSFESRDTFKSAPKLKELPRLSLDSCERSMRGSSYLTESFHSSGNLDGRVINPRQSPGLQKRPTNVIAKLMGLESFPSSSSAGDNQLGVTKTCSVEDNNPFLRSLRANDPSRLTGTSPTRSSLKDPTSPRWKNPDLIMKPISSSRFPIEPAPWRHADGSRGSRKPLNHVKVPSKNPNSFPSVYGEIENKLKDLEFKQSGKDFRALKQIIEAMQAKGLLETQKEQATNLVTQRDYEPKCTNIGQNSRGQQSPQSTRINTSTTRGPDSNRTYESPIVIMKPAKLVEKVDIRASKVIPIDEFSNLPKVQSGGPVDNKKGLKNGRAARDRTARNGHSDSASSSTDKRASSRNIKAIQSSMKPPKESTATSGKNSGQVSPRLQPKKLESDRRSRPPTPPSDPSKPRRQSNRLLSESGTSGGKHGPKSPDMQQCDDQLSQLNTESWTSSHQVDAVSLQSDNNIILRSKLGVEVPSHEPSIGIIGSQSSSVKAPKCSISSIMPKKSALRVVEDGSIEEPAMVAPEHPSPVSVLDTSIYRDDEPSPVKQLSNTSEGNGAENLNEDHNDEQWNPADKCSVNNAGSGFTSKINRKKLQNIEHLVQKLRRLNSGHDEASTDYIALLCGNTKPDHRYISEILLASGLLMKDLGSGLTTFQLHPSGHPINPELFFVLEQTKASSLLSKEESNTGNVSLSKADHEKFHRKLIFDSVNEILLGKLALFGAFPELTLNLGKLATKSLTAHQLLKELCFEIEQLQAKKAKCDLEENEDGLKSILWEDVMSRSVSWMDFNGDISGMVLDVERLVFKDLVNEIVIGEEGSLRAKQSRQRRRRLFSK